MASELVNSVTAAEKEAGQALKKAGEESEAVIAAAAERSAQLQSELKAEALSKAEAVKAEAEERAADILKYARETAADSAERIKTEAAAGTEKAVNEIIKMITG